MANPDEPTFSVRRVITGHDAQGVACVIIDDLGANARTTGEGNNAMTVWCTDATPCDISLGASIADTGAWKTGSPPPANGTRFSVTEMPPGAVGKMHRTDSLDYIIVLAGSVDMELDGSTVTLRSGDVMVQRGTKHRWINRGTEPARVAFVFVDAQPLGIGAPVPRGMSASQMP